MKRNQVGYLVWSLVTVLGVGFMFALQLRAEPGSQPGRLSLDLTMTPSATPTYLTSTPPPQTSREPTATPVAQFFAPAVFDTASTPTDIPPPTVEPPTGTPPPPPGTKTATPENRSYAPAVFDTVSTATHTPVPTVTPLVSPTHEPTETPPAP